MVRKKASPKTYLRRIQTHERTLENVDDYANCRQTEFYGHKLPSNPSMMVITRAKIRHLGPQMGESRCGILKETATRPHNDKGSHLTVRSRATVVDRAGNKRREKIEKRWVVYIDGLYERTRRR